MSRRRPYRALGMFTFVAFVSSATPVTADQYFGENPLLFTSYATFFGVFMQHSGSELAREGLHKGIDILGRSDVGEQVFSANTNVVQVVWEDETEGQLMFARIDDCMNMEAFLVAHLDPGTIPLEMDPGYNFSSSRFVGRLDTRLPYYPHLHAEIYKNFPLGEIWSHCWSARWPPWDINPPGNDELKEWLVNPVLYAFEYAQWRMDDCEHCSPVISNGPEVMRESDTYFVYFTAYDVNNSTYYDAYDTQCKPGIYEASLYVDSGSDAVDQFHFTRFRDKQNAYPPLAGQFYWDPWDPPGGCNRYDELEYFLFWQNPDWPDTGHHEFRVVVRDAYGNSAEGDVMYGTVVPEVRMDCELRDGKVYIRWHLEGTSPSLGELTLHRSADARTLGCKLNPCPIHTQDESHQPIEDFVFVDDVPVYWDTL